MTISLRLTSLALAVSIGCGAIVAPGAAMASEEGKKNTAIGIAAAAAALLLTQRNKLPGVVAAAGAAYAYKKYDDDVRARHRQDDYGYGNRRDDRDHNDRYDRNSDRDRSHSDDRDHSDYRYKADSNWSGSHLNGRH